MSAIRSLPPSRGSDFGSRRIRKRQHLNESSIAVGVGLVQLTNLRVLVDRQVYHYVVVAVGDNQTAKARNFLYSMHLKNVSAKGPVFQSGRK